MILKGKTAIVTGSTSGIGLGIAQAFAKIGVNVVINGFGDEKEIACLIETLSKHNVDAIYHGADMREPDTIEDLVQQAQSHFGSVDILVNNAGIQHVAPVEEFPKEKWDDVIATDLSAAFHTTRCVLPLMRKNQWGRVINIASAHALVASPYKSAYVAAKHGLLGLTKVVALEVAQQGITCNSICPGYVHTPLVDNQIADTAKARGISEETVVRDVLLSAQWTKQFVSIEQVAQIALFLCSDAAANITGIALSVDGGWTAA
jgi:3-hydroxybutyrate dehydrogenase